jgi:osmotically-inducible protein OsmY
MRATPLVISLLLVQTGFAAGETSTFRAYVDTDICARLMFGPITPERMACSEKMGKEKNELLLVRLSNNMLFTVNKQKMIENMAGQLAEASGEVNIKAGTMKLQDVKAIEPSAVPTGPERRLLGKANRSEPNPQTWEKVRHELAMLPYITEFDFISFTMTGADVILTGWCVRDSNRDTAYNVVKGVPGVESVVNNINTLPLGRMDMQIRASARAALQRSLGRYFWRSGSAIKIIVKDGQIILLGTVTSKGDSDLANMLCNGVPGAFKVYNLLRVETPTKKAAQTSAAGQKAAKKGA